MEYPANCSDAPPENMKKGHCALYSSPKLFRVDTSSNILTTTIPLGLSLHVSIRCFNKYFACSRYAIGLPVYCGAYGIVGTVP